MSLTLPFPILHSLTDAERNFDQLGQSVATDDDVATTSAAQLAVYRLVTSEHCVIPGSTAATTGIVAAGSLLGTGGTTGAAPTSYLAAATFAVQGYATNLRLSMTLAVNATAPAVNFTAALAPISSVAGGAGVIAYTLGTNVVTAAINAPSASAMAHVEASDVAFPSDGYYVLTLTTSGTTAANSRVGANLRLDMRHV